MTTRLRNSITRIGLIGVPTRTTPDVLTFIRKRDTDKLTMLGMYAAPARRYMPFSPKRPFGGGSPLRSPILASRIIQ